MNDTFQQPSTATPDTAAIVSAITGAIVTMLRPTLESLTSSIVQKEMAGLSAKIDDALAQGIAFRGASNIIAGRVETLSAGLMQQGINIEAVDGRIGSHIGRLTALEAKVDKQGTTIEAIVDTIEGTVTDHFQVMAPKLIDERLRLMGTVNGGNNEAISAIRNRMAGLEGRLDALDDEDSFSARLMTGVDWPSVIRHTDIAALVAKNLDLPDEDDTREQLRTMFREGDFNDELHEAIEDRLGDDAFKEKVKAALEDATIRLSDCTASIQLP